MLVRRVALLALLRPEGRRFGRAWWGEGACRAVAWLRWLPPAEREFSGALFEGRAVTPRVGERPAGGSLSRSVGWAG